MRIAAAAVFVLAVAVASRVFADTAPASGLVIIQAGTVLAVPGRSPLRDQSIMVRGDRIVAVRPGFVTEPGARIIDLRDEFALPGLIDLHVHLTTTPQPGGEMNDVTLSAADLALMAASNAARTLAAGFTTVLDLGTGRRNHEQAVFALRDAIAAGSLPGPRVLAVGSPLSIPGQSRTRSFRPEVDTVVGPENVCSGADDCRRTVRAQVQRGADVISFYNSGSLLSKPSVAMTFTQDEMNAIVVTAHALGRKVVADGGNTPGDASGINAALRAGVDSIDTVTYPDAETWRLLKNADAYFVPHLYALQAAVGDSTETIRQGTMGWLPLPVLEFLLKLKRQPPSAIEGRRSGARFAFGSDPGVFPHGDNAREFPELTKVGLAPMQAIAAATVSAAAMLGRDHEFGTIEAGKAADIIAVPGSPLDDIHQLEEVGFVMSRGRIYREQPSDKTVN